MTKQFLQETNFQDDSDQDPIEFRAKDQVQRNRQKWIGKEIDDELEYDTYSK